MGVRTQAIALERLKAKLVVLAEERQLAEVAELRGDAVKADRVRALPDEYWRPFDRTLIE